MALNWTRDELLLAMRLYCRLPFGRLHRRNPAVVDLALLLGRTPSAVAMKLTNLASLDPAVRASGRAGLSGIGHLDREVWDEFEGDWTARLEEAESVFEARVAESPGRGLNPPVPHEYPTSAPDTERQATTTVRVGHERFHDMVLASYEGRCCVTDMGCDRLLVASHVVAWAADTKQRLNPRNGVCLNALHDRAFDRHLMTIGEDYRVVYSRALRGEVTADAWRQFFQPYDGHRIRLPVRFTPDADLLARHRQLLQP